MKLIWSKYRKRGFTVLDLIIVLLTLLLAVFLLPRVMFNRSRVSCGRTRCVSNLQQVGLAFRLWSSDHGEKFPMAVSNREGGTSEFLKSNEVIQHFLVISNEVN